MVNAVPSLEGTRLLYLLFVGAVAVQRLVEVRLAARNARGLLARGGVEAGRDQLPLMVLLHATFLVACPLEVWLLQRPLVPWIAAPALAAFAAAQGLRYWTIRTLGPRWTIRVMAVPGATPVAHGPYRFIRHPNYAAVAVEMAAIPLVHGAWVCAVVFSVLDGILLARRIRVEERLLRAVGPYADVFAARPRFVPHV